jgi:hypothetical protein
MAAAGRVLFAGLSLLDRQLLDRHGLACGKVDDLELEYSPDSGALYVAAVLAGPGVLAYRLRRRRWGRWWQRVNQLMSPTAGDPARISMAVVANIGNHLDLGVDRDHLGTMSVDNWVREHVTSRIPGSGHEEEG